MKPKGPDPSIPYCSVSFHIISFGHIDKLLTVRLVVHGLEAYRKGDSMSGLI